MISVATAWVFSQDLGFSEAILGSWVFSEGLGLFLGFSKGPLVFLGFFKICPKIHLFLLFFAESKTFLAKKGQNLRNQGKKFWKSEAMTKKKSSEILANRKAFFRKSLVFSGKVRFFQKFPENV